MVSTRKETEQTHDILVLAEVIQSVETCTDKIRKGHNQVVLGKKV